MALKHATHTESFLPHVSTSIWANPALRMGFAIAVPALTGLLMAVIMPRGPVVTRDALLLVLTGFATGGIAAYLLGSRWAMVIAPVAHLAIFEIARMGEIGPTVDRPELDTTFGILALLLGRGVYIALGIVPMILGAAYGAAIARWQEDGVQDATVASTTRRIIGGVVTIGLVALAVRIARPAKVPAMTDKSGNRIDDSISQLEAVTLGGQEQWIEMRGANQELPVLLYLSGGPGQSDLPYSRVLFEELTQDFIVVGWDQRGTGKSYPALNPESMTLKQAVADTIELSDWLRHRFAEKRIILLGESWGSTLGVLAVQQAPDRYHAYIGSGQMVSQRATDQIIYDDLLAWADANGETDLAAKLRDTGPPPYASHWTYAEIMTYYPKLEGSYDPPQAYVERGESSNLGPWGVFGSEYTGMDKVNVLRGLMDTFATMYPQLQEIDFRKDVPSLDVPVYLMEGEHELRGRLELAEEWFDMLEAPRKELYILENAGHSVAFEQADELHRILMEEIRPTLYAEA
ncbi:MAG: alpha/beta hydrolase [Thermomicrobiales bacterium]|nr:alpha/beta hydrolase [Thermomicrobiales bacterium]MCO5218880.1 alpha/beta hydrolase [Thermomicrobiales bacterium]MCO5225682.1 alpha/beta hydrolase [Thermomicrobiales bacterium]MCO5227966.1 alpha/beta hydrolase [Thermomicrobiales bacterium]